MVNGWNGKKLTGSFLSTTSARDSFNLTGAFFWNSIGDRTALHFYTKELREFFDIPRRADRCVGKRC